MCLKCQSKIQLGFESTFSGWARIVSKRTCIVFWVSLVFFFLLACGQTQSKLYPDENIVWTPEGNPSLVNKDKAEVLFPVEEKFRPVSLVIESKTDDSIVNVETMKKMAEFENLLYTIKANSKSTVNDNNEIVESTEGFEFGWEDICIQQTYQRVVLGKVQEVTKCRDFGMLSFVYNKNLHFENPASRGIDLTTYNSDNKILFSVNSGLSGGEYVQVSNVFGGVTPTEGYYQVDKTSDAATKAKGAIGSNNLKTAMASQNSWTIKISRGDALGIDEKAYHSWEDKLLKAFAEKWDKAGDKDEKVILHLYTIQGFFEAIVEDINYDFSLVGSAILLVVIYTFLFLGAFSPVHCRTGVACVGIFSILLAYGAGFGFMYLVGAMSTGVHQLMPFLLVGIGVDDMFVLCNAVDQTDIKAKTEERMYHALGHAGPAITITSLTNALAFAFGATGSLPALRSFCLFASACIVMLYLLVMTLFLSVVVWDTRRVENKRRECCQACFCSEQSIICCRGKFLSKKQSDYSGIEQTPAQKQKREQDMAKYDAATIATLDSSTTEIILGKYFAPVVLSTVGRIVFLMIYVLLTALMCYGASEVRIHFEIEYFISKQSPVYGWFQANKEFFDSGAEGTVIFIESDDLDWSDPVNQDKATTLLDEIQKCESCEKQWHLDNSMSSWLPKYHEWVAGNGCPSYTPTSSAIQAVPKAKFYDCLSIFFKTDKGRIFYRDIAFKDGTKIKGWRQVIYPKRLQAVSTDGPQYLEDIRVIEDKYSEGFDCYSFSQMMLDYEQYVVFVKETVLSICLSLMAVFFVVLFVTGSAPVTCLVLFAVIMVDVWLLGLIHFWDLTMNNIIVVQLVIGLGLAVDYSAHIAHTFLTVTPPKEYTEAKDKRMYKARVAVSQMGSSVIHGGFSTFLAIIVLAGARSYIFVVFFRLWFGIIVFGMSNGFILLPIILSFIGPVTEDEELKGELVRRNTRRKSQMGIELTASEKGKLEDAARANSVE